MSDSAHQGYLPVHATQMLMVSCCQDAFVYTVFFLSIKIHTLKALVYKTWTKMFSFVAYIQC